MLFSPGDDGMRSLVPAAVLLALIPISSLSQVRSEAQDAKAAQASSGTSPAVGRTSGSNQRPIDLLSIAEGEAGGLDGEMRGWALWQIGLAYQSVDKAKALSVLRNALVAVHSSREETSVPSIDKNPITGSRLLPPKLVLERDIASSIVRLEPKRTDDVFEEVDPVIRSAILISVLEYQEKEKHFDVAIETLNRICAQDEMPYKQAMALMDNFKPEQSGQLSQLFVMALASYREHAPHLQFHDDFSPMLVRFWKRLPDKVVREGIDEILRQAADNKKQSGYSFVSDKRAASFRSLYEYRLFQILPVIQAVDPSAAEEYRKEYPSMSSNDGNSGRAEGIGSPSNTQSEKAQWFHANNSSVMASLTPEYSVAEKIATESDSGHMDQAVSDAANLRDPNLRAQIYEYIAGSAAKKQESVAKRALEGMLQTAEKQEPANAVGSYATAAKLYQKIDEVDEAKESIEAGWKVAGKLYQKDADEDDPNTALKAFWPSTNAYCGMLRLAASISDTWAISLLDDIKDADIRTAAEIALAGGLLKSPGGPSTTMVVKKNGSSFGTSQQSQF